MGTGTTERPTTIENIKVLQVGKFGVRIDEKTWFGVNQPLTPQHFQVGEGYKVSATTSKTGKKYICEILGTEVKNDVPSHTVTPPSTPAPTPTPATDPVKVAEAALAKAKADAEVKAAAATAKPEERPSRAGFGQPLTNYDLAKEKQITRSGIYQAALQSPAAVQWATSIDEYLSNVRKIADAGMRYVQE